MKDKIDRLSKLYALTYKRKVIPMKFFIPFMYIMRKRANKILDNHSDIFLNQKIDPSRIHKGFIVSLTSFPARIDYVWKTIVSIKRQSVLPEKVILYLSQDEFGDRPLPENLIKLQDDVFQIKMVNENLKSHKKYYYSFEEFPDKTIITLDDDMYYQKDILKYLIETSLEFPEAVVANRVSRIRKRGEEVLPYNQWKNRYIKKGEKDLFPIGVDGILYPPGHYRNQMLQKDIFMEITPIGDDIWLNGISRLNNKEIRYTGYKYRSIPTAESTPALETKNCEEGYNDRQIKALRQYIISSYGIDIYTSLK